MTEFERVQEDLNWKTKEIREAFPDYRLGQVLSVMLRLDYPEMFKVISGTEADPWDQDEAIPCFWDAVRYLCEKG